MILSPNNEWYKIFFLSCPKHWDRRLLIVLVYYIQIWNKKKRNIIIIIIIRVICIRIGPMYIETPNM